MEESIKSSILNTLHKLNIEAGVVILDFPTDPSHGDISSNAAMMYAKKAGISPLVLAEDIKKALDGTLEGVEKIEIVAPGFINFFFSRDFFTSLIQTIRDAGDSFGKNASQLDTKVIVEYTDPNPFKEFHIGHLMSNAIGESISRLVEFSSAEVRRANYQGDVGLHVAKSIWGMLHDDGNSPAENDSLESKIAFVGNAYVFGSTAYEESEEARSMIHRINREVYEKNSAQTNNLYDMGKRWSLEKFEELYAVLGTAFDFYFFESETSPLGKKLVENNIDTGVFTRSEGAVVFEGERRDPTLHTRVFITKDGMPTYEAKDLPLSSLKYEKFPFDTSIIITAVEQKEYFRVVLKALEELNPDLSKKTLHIAHGMLMLPSGKMSSRKGGVITGESLLFDAIHESEKKITGDWQESEKRDIAEKVGVAAIKYSVLRQSIGKNIIFEFDKSLSFEGDSGPYLQYSVVRARSVLAKSDASAQSSEVPAPEKVFRLETLLYRFPAIIKKSQSEMSPHHVVTYLTELAGEFNSFYAQEKIVDDLDIYSPYKIALTDAFVQVMTNGLYILGIRIPDNM